MNILLVNIWFDARKGTGTAERTRQLAHALADLGCRCSILTLGQGTESENRRVNNIRVYSIGYLGCRYPIPLLRPYELWRLIRAADIVHVTGHWYLLAAAVCFMARLARVTVVLSPAGELLAYEPSEWPKRWYQRLVGRHTMAWAAAIIAITAAERNDFIRRFGIASSRIIISPNGVSPSPAIEIDQISLRAASFVLFVGRLAVIKAPDLLVEAFAAISTSFPDINLVMIGPDCGMRAGLEARVRELGLSERIRFLGFVDESQLQSFYERAALLAVPSRSEVMSIVALEAAAMGTPVLLTKSCGFNEVGEIGGGLVVDVNPRAIAEGLATMLSDRAALQEMGQRLRQFVLEHYSWPKVARNLLDELAKIVQRAC